ncbi:MAG: hypothetical protein DCE90_18730 [Pseudanabaena sp.]|nr:MAG: hypothetical protein DCE90_18730 [Pseudanabaena sp.]
MKVLIAASLGILSASVGVSSVSAAGFNLDVTSSENCLSPNGCTTGVAHTVTIDFNSNLGAPSTGFAQYSPNGTTQLFTGSQSGLSATPFKNTTPYLSLPTNKSAVISFGGLVDYFGLYWGSVDTYNSVEFKKGGVSLATFGGQQIANLVQSKFNLPSPQFASWTSNFTNVYVDFFAGSEAKQFDTVVLKSTGIAFETDNHAYRAVKPVPVPGMVLGVIAAAGAFAAKRKKAAKA